MNGNSCGNNDKCKYCAGLFSLFTVVPPPVDTGVWPLDDNASYIFFPHDIFCEKIKDQVFQTKANVDTFTFCQPPVHLLPYSAKAAC